MELTDKNDKILRALGFKPDDECVRDWWHLEDGWTFRLDKIRSFKELVKRVGEKIDEKIDEN